MIFLSGIASFLTKHYLKFILIGGGILLIVGVSMAAYNLAKTTMANQLKAVQAQAYNSGKLEANNATLTASQAKMEENMRVITQYYQQTSDQLAAIRTDAKKLHAQIASYDVKTTAKTNPQAVEDWANKTTKDNFTQIETESKKK